MVVIDVNDGHAQSLERTQHPRRVIRNKQIVDISNTFGQRGKQQDSIGYALGTGQANHPLGIPDCREINKIQVLALRIIFMKKQPVEMIRREC
jgi:hypothetical protein